ncbi:MAG: DEAD/DEAH box helicase [Crocinitomicaceae bacterium]
MNTNQYKKQNKTASHKRSGGNANRQQRNKRSSSIDPQRLVKKASPIGETEYVSDRTFDQMNLHQGIIKNLKHKGYERPTQIQDEAIEKLVDGSDLIGIAKTGTGKTGAFLIPIVENLLRAEKPFQSIVIVPTRELAIQVEEEFKSIAHQLNLSSVCLIGGTSVNRDVERLKKFNHLIIGTPGRLMDMQNRRVLHLDRISVLVLDEFDRMLDMGFVKDIRKMVSQMRNRKQSMLFSATRDTSQASIIKEIVKNPFEVQVSSGQTTSDHVDQDIIRVKGGDKFGMLLDLVKKTDFEKVILFAETKRLVDRLNKKLNQSGIKSDLIHGNKSQNYRSKALDKLKAGKIKILVATDVAARGIDVSNISHVINYQLPMDIDTYIHRIGRTGRAGKAGKAFTFVD